jgi:hypothetical protein
MAASRDAMYARNSSGVQRLFFGILVLLVFTAQDGQHLNCAARYVGERTEDLHDLVPVDPFFVHAPRVPGDHRPRKVSSSDTMTGRALRRCVELAVPA